MKKLLKFKTVIRIFFLSLLMILITGVDSFSDENGKSKDKTAKVTKKVSEKKNDLPKPLIDETPINPRNVSKGNKDESNSVDSSDTSNNKQKTKNKKK